MSSPARLPAEHESLALLDTYGGLSVEDRPECETVRFLIPRRALAAIDPLAIIAEARRDGVHRRRIGVGDRGGSAEQTCVTCGFPMAVRIFRAIERVEIVAASECDGSLAADLAVANRSAIAALGSRVQRPE